MKVVVAGGAGFLGSHLCDALLARGDQVIAIDDLSTGALDNVAQHDANPAFRFFKADVSRDVPDRKSVV